ncbi:UbiA family prenyltransferase [Legionella gresilensis]|uniref:UbiA family prenyltransferase n=1 Tax=Legionella gresilensis TaxID=91823 RepID=UPI0010415894|nr:UbiA family prenyltransferase [Legionella gresilensis]
MIARYKKIPSLTFSFWKSYFILMRPYLLFISGITGLLGMAQAQAPFSLIFIILFLVFFFSYGAGQALTDCYQIDTDSLSSPYRPLVTGQLNKESVFFVSLSFLILANALLAVENYYNIFVASLATIGLMTYTYFKRRFWGGPLYNGWIVAALYVLGYQSFKPIAWQDEHIILTLLTVLFAYAHFVLVGYFKDIEADRSTAYNTLPVVYGRKISCHISTFFAIAALSSTWLIINLEQSISSISLLVFLISLIVYTVGQILLYQNKTDDTAYKPILFSVHAYIILMMSLILQSTPSWLIFMMSYYVFFVIALKYRPCKTQI